MHPPRIGIPLTLDDRGRWREGRAYHYIDRSYADAIVRAGGIPLEIPIQPSPEALVESLDGLLIPGGDDFPAEAALPADASLELVSSEQLAFDEALFRAASLHGLPIFGICYGMQLMARSRGGVLDAYLPGLPGLPGERADVGCHKLSPDARHPVSIARESRLAGILKTEACDVNSLHHQAVRSVGPTHQIVATSPDGVIEAIERGGDPTGVWEVGVQWHPEKMAEESSDLLFRAFVDACRRSGGNR